MQVIDGYCHCGLSKYNPLPVLERVLKKSNISKAVLVQHIGEYDNSYIKSIVDGNPQCFAGVFMIDYGNKNSINHLTKWAETKSFRGVRLSIESLEVNKSLWMEALYLNLNIVAYSLENMIKKLDLLINFLDEFPKAPVIISHLGFPDLKKDKKLKKHSRIFELSCYPNVYFQVSGMHMFCKYPYYELWPVIERGLIDFGDQRMFWGSNYPPLGEDDYYLKERLLLDKKNVDHLPCAGYETVSAETAFNLWFEG